MFQNITDNREQSELEEEDIREGQAPKGMLLKSLFSMQNIIIYAISAMVSMVSFHGQIAPFGLAIFGAVCANQMAARNSIYFVFYWDTFGIWIRTEP